MRGLFKETTPGMSDQDKHLVIAWNAFVSLFIMSAHSDIAEAYVDAKVYYRLAGRPDLAIRVGSIGYILIWWGFLAKFYALFMFPLLLVNPYLPSRYRMPPRQLALVIIVAFFVYTFLIPYLLYY